MPLIFDTLPIKRIEVDLLEAEGRTASTRMASWMRFKSFFPNITAPVFHATSGPRAAMIALRGEGIKAESGYSNFGGQSGISLSRDLSFLLKGGFGNVIFVLDYQSLARRFDVTPIQHPAVSDEFEERVYTDLIPSSMILGVIINAPLLKSIAQEWVDSVPYPVVHLSKDRTTWVRADGPFKTATLDESEKEEREDKRLIQKDPKFKPPRQDLRRRDVEDRDTRGDDDSDEKQDKKDRSKNYKDAAAIQRVAIRYMAIRVAARKSEDQRKLFLKSEGKRKLKNPTTGKDVTLSTLSRGDDKQREVFEKEFQKWLSDNSESKSESIPAPKSPADSAGPAESPTSPDSPSESLATPDSSKPAKPAKPAKPNSDKVNLAEAKKKFDTFKKALSYEHRAIIDSFDDDDGVMKKVLEKFDSVSNDLKKVDDRKLIEEFDTARKQLDEMSETDNIDPKTAIHALCVSMFETKILKDKTPKIIQNQIEKTFSDFNDADDYRSVESVIRDLPTFSQEKFNQQLKSEIEASSKEALASLSDPKLKVIFDKKLLEARAYFSSDVAKKRKFTNPDEAVKHAAVLAANHKNNDPMVRFSIPEDKTPSIKEPSEQATDNDDFANSTYQQLLDNDVTADSAKEYGDRLYQQIQGLPENSISRDRAISAYNAIKIYQITRTKPNEEIEGVIPQVANAIRAAHRAGMERDFLNTANDVGKSEGQRLQNLTDKVSAVYQNLTDNELLEFLPESDSLSEVAKSVFGKDSPPSARAFVRNEIMDVVLSQFRFAEALDSPLAEKAETTFHEDVKKITSGKNWFSKPDLKKKFQAAKDAYLNVMLSIWGKLENFKSTMSDKLRKSTNRKASAQVNRVVRRYIENSDKSFIRYAY